jgi:hypothetical protein
LATHAHNKGNSGLRDAIDYAGLFPPAALTANAAAKEYLQQRSDPTINWLFKRFVVPLSRVDELKASFRLALAAEDTKDCVVPCAFLLPLPNDETQACTSLRTLSRIFKDETVSSQIGAHNSAHVRFVAEAVEWQLPDLTARNWWDGWPHFRSELMGFLQTYPALHLFVEQSWTALSAPHAAALLENMATIHREQPSIKLKLRTGGLNASAVPPLKPLAELIHKAVGSRLPFKCTAGLHSALREVSPRFGFEMHGFINVATSVAAALSGADAQTLVSILEAKTTDAILAAIRYRSQPANNATELAHLVAQSRDLFVSFGSCSVREPYESLLHHGLVVEPTNQKGESDAHHTNTPFH